MSRQLIIRVLLKKIISGINILFLCVTASAGADIKVNFPSSGSGEYELTLLKLALSKLNTNHSVSLVDEAGATQARVIERVRSGEIDLMWAATNKELESSLLPIRIPLYKGLLGYRILLIEKKSQEKFNAIAGFNDLKSITFGQGKTWTDTDILRANGLNVITATKYESLFYMLDGGRFDAFPRGIQEPWKELGRFDGLSLKADEKLLFVYKMPLYFFTRKENSNLAANLEQGFYKAIADGSFDEVFWSSSLVQEVLKKSKLKQRRVFYLDNPGLPAETPIDKKELWVDMDELIRMSN